MYILNRITANNIVFFTMNVIAEVFQAVVFVMSTVIYSSFAVKPVLLKCIMLVMCDDIFIPLLFVISCDFGAHFKKIFQIFLVRTLLSILLSFRKSVSC